MPLASVHSAEHSSEPHAGAAASDSHSPNVRASERTPGRESHSDSAVLPYTKINTSPNATTDSTGPRVPSREPPRVIDPRQQRAPHQVLLDRVNYYRKRAGVTPVISDWRLRKSAQSHADYLSTTSSVGHLEHDTRNAYYTGEDPYRRINAAGYVFAQAGEVVAKTASRDVAAAVDRLMDAVYHRFVILSSDLTHAGAAAGRKAARDDETTEVTIDFAAAASPIARGSTLIVYPAREQTGIPAAFDATTEIPNPMPGRTVVGSPISVQADSGLELTVDVFRISAVSAATTDGFLSSRLLVHSDDADTPPWAAALIPERPLLPRTAYRVEFSGKVDGNAVAQTWTFTTASQ